MESSRHPAQPVYLDDEGVLRFRHNRIVAFLMETSRFNHNDLAELPFSVEDREQFAQLIGYSVSGFAELPYVRDATVEAALMLCPNAIASPRPPLS